LNPQRLRRSCNKRRKKERKEKRRRSKSPLRSTSNNERSLKLLCLKRENPTKGLTKKLPRNGASSNKSRETKKRLQFKSRRRR